MPEPICTVTPEQWAAALADPDVSARLAFHGRHLGRLSPEVLLIAMLDWWDGDA